MANSTAIRPSLGRIICQSNRTSPAISLALPILTAKPALSCPFSTTPELQERRPKRDNNRLRGLSSLYRSGFPRRMVVDGVEVPKPVKYTPKIDVDPNHGLWDFFYAKDILLLTPEEDAEHGRSWTVNELRHKSWDDLHKLWWVCVKERNRIATAERERRRLKLRKGDDESIERDHVVRNTMKHIKQALTERFYAWEDARELAKQDSEIDLNDTANPYVPSDYEYIPAEDEELETSNKIEGEATGEHVEEKFMEEPEKPKAEKVDPSTTIEPKTSETQNTTRP